MAGFKLEGAVRIGCKRVKGIAVAKCFRAWRPEGCTLPQHAMLEFAFGSNTLRPYEHTAKFTEHSLTPPRDSEEGAFRSQLHP